MRSFQTSGSIGRDARRGLWLALKLSAVALGIGLVMSAGPVRAGDDGDDDDDMTFEEKLIDNLMSGIGAKSMEKKGIEYRERSPLVVPPNLDLPPPASADAANAPNWPKDPDEKRRKAAIAERKKAGNKQAEYLKMRGRCRRPSWTPTRRPAPTRRSMIRPSRAPTPTTRR